MKQFIEYAKAVCYSGYRKNQSPADNIFPSENQIIQDLEIILKNGFSYIRMYDANEYAENVCRIITEKKLPLKAMLGPGLINEKNNTGCPWDHKVYTEEELNQRHLRNQGRIEKLCQIANKFPEATGWVSIGNENTPDWGENSVSENQLIEYAEYLRSHTGKPVTFNEGAREWPKLTELAKHLDIISVHSYPLWYGLKVEDALEANKKDFENVKKCFPDKQIIFTETGWATSCAANTQMAEGQASEINQKKYLEEFCAWTETEKITSFLFEAFDEPWKGGANPIEAEKHWGLFNEDRSPKLFMQHK